LTGTAARPRYERELAGPVRGHLEGLGYRVWVDPDGTDYFDVVARKGREIALIELKLADGRTVLLQAQRRRAWADWAAVAVPSERLARRIAQRPVAERGARVGVWAVVGTDVRVVRPAQRFVAPGEPDMFADSREALHERLDLVEDGRLPLGIPWHLASASRRAMPGGRSSRDWRLEEFGPDRD
jgi:hypothetical protein